MSRIHKKTVTGLASVQSFCASQNYIVLLRGRLGVLALFLSALLLSGCSGLSFVYGLAENAIAGEAEFHLDLDDVEAARVDEAIGGLLAWHSSVMLPRYAHFLGAQAEIIDRGPIDAQQAADAVAELRVILDELVTGAAPFTAKVLVDHTSLEKVNYLKARMAERLAERREELAEPPAERLESRVERIVDNFERLTGDLDDPQKDIIRRYAEETTGANEAWLRARTNRQRVFTDFLAQKPSEAQISLFIQRILLRPYELVDPAYKSVSDARWMRFQVLLHDILSSLTAEQRGTASETLREYAAELLELSS